MDITRKRYTRMGRGRMGERGLWIGWMTMTVGSVIRVAGVVEAVVVAVEAVVEAAVAVAASAAVGMVGSAFPNRARIGVHRRAGVDLPIASHPPSTMSDDNTATNTDDTTTVTFGSSRAVPRAIKDPLERIPAANETTANPEEEEEGVPPSNRTTRTTTTSTEVGPPVPSGCPRTFRNRRSKTRLSSSGASPARRRVGEARPPRAERDRRRRRRHPVPSSRGCTAPCLVPGAIDGASTSRRGKAVPYPLPTPPRRFARHTISPWYPLIWNRS
mmetsp:Transcript_25171/g.45549  ORF Transcript_25171/g.45549 Transcript_25171/m.45549 type:complete len:272 (+) Transcript_25171:294-1109(+)